MTATSRPTLALDLGGQPLPTGLQGNLSGVRVLRRASLPAACEVTLLCPQLAGPLPAAEPGLPLSLRIDGGWLFSGDVTAVTLSCLTGGTRELRLRAYDPLHRLRARSPLRARGEVRLSELAGELAADLGLALSLEEGLPDLLWTGQLQAGRSDFQVLAELALRVGVSFAVQDGTLALFGPGGSGPSLALELGRTLLEARVEQNVNALRETVRVSGWSPRSAEAVGGSAAQASPGAGIGLPGPFGATGRELVGLELEDEAQARALAQAELDRAAASARTLHGVAEGDPRLRPGLPVQVGGLGTGWDGRFVLSEVTHTFDPRLGFLSEVGSGPPARSEADPHTAGAVATLGEVGDVQDPAGLGRVRVALPAYGDLTGEWMPVVCAAAGPGKGLMALPDRGDRVLVLLTRGDPAQGVVLGGLYGGSGLTDPGVTPDGTRRFTLRTAGGELLLLDGRDADGGVTLQDRHGTTLAFRPDGVRLTANADLLLEAPGRRITVRADRIDFERG